MIKEIIDHGFGVIETRETFYTEETIKQKDKTIADLAEKLALTEKALELACLSLRGKCDYCKHKDDETCPSDHHCSNLVMKYFLEQAKEMMKNE